jgi:broad specificity phosphatase PhoE
MKHRKSEKAQTLADNARLLRAWRRFHAEQLEEALAGAHGAVMTRLMKELKGLRSARELVDFIATQDWTAVNAEVRLVALHEINTVIMKWRERRGLEPIGDNPEFPVTKRGPAEPLGNNVKRKRKNVETEHE